VDKFLTRGIVVSGRFLRYHFVMKILITTGIYPPAIGGPAQYAKNLAQALERAGHKVRVARYTFEYRLPTGLRHLWFFCKILFSAARADFVIALDTWSVGLPSVAAGAVFGTPVIIRTGGDFLWEFYVERTGDLVLLKNFYQTSISKFNLKERLIFRLTGFTLRNAKRLVFSAGWQRMIFQKPYKLDLAKTAIVENFYGPKIGALPSSKKNFIAGVRKLKWKNTERLRTAFETASRGVPNIELDLHTYAHEEFIKKVRECYAVILVSLGDISPNTVIDALSCGKPVILTRENGLYEKLKDSVIYADPENVADISSKIVWLCDPKNYATARARAEAFKFEHSWEEIAREFIDIYQKL